MHDWSVLRAAAEETDLDADEMQKLTDGGKYKAVVDGSTAQAQLLGITGVPAYILGNKYANNGAQPYDAFQE